MRPVKRGVSPQATDFADYQTAKPFLISRLGAYCSYCERPINTMLAVEHIQPKSLPGYANLEGSWTNFLLACVNCNSSKLAKDVLLHALLLPDRDNTAIAFVYSRDGQIDVNTEVLQPPAQALARTTLGLAGLQKVALDTLDENGRLVALDRVAQRMQAWIVALEALQLRNMHPESTALRQVIIRLAQATGFFSIWMKAFASDMEMRLQFVAAFPGTAASGCFDLGTGEEISPCPNTDGLEFGGKL